MPKYRPQEIVEKEFDEKFDHINSRNGGGRICDGICDKEYTLEDVKSFISSLRLQDKKDLLDEINEWAEKNKKGTNSPFDLMLEIRLEEIKQGGISTADSGIGYNKCISDLQAFIKSKQ